MKIKNIKNILITGVAGLLGSRLADWIIKNKPNINIIGIDNLSGGYIENVPEKIKFYKYDLVNDGQKIEELFKYYNFDLVYHFAAYAAEGLSPFIRKFNYKNNLIATTQLINFSIKYNIKRFVFTSSMAVYGHGEFQPPFAESFRPMPIDPYGIAKYACEMDLKIAGEQHGLDWCIIRPHNIYGKKQNIWDKYRNVLGIWMYQYMNNQDLTIFGTGNQKRAFSYIDDCLEPFWKAGTSKLASKEIINLGGIKEYTINEACDTLIKVIGDGNKKYLEKRHEVFYAWPTYQKSIDLLDYKQNTSLQDGLIEMWNWAKLQPIKKRKEWKEFELEKGIYSFWKSK